MEYGASSRPKRILSDIILTFGQLRRKSTLPYFLAIFGVYFVFPVYNLMNGKFSLTGFPAERSLSAYASAAGLLLLFSLVHLLYISSITSYFEHVSLLSFLKNCKLKLMQGIGLIFGIMLVYAISNINSTPVDFSSGGVWTGVFFNYLKLYTAYFLLAFGSILLVDKKSVREILGHFSVKSFFIMIIKVLITIVLIDLLSSPFVYYIESQLIMGDPFASSSAAYSWIYFVLECLINSAVVMLLYNYIELLIHKKNRRILHPGAYKKIILLCLVFIYLFIWFTCGIAFQAMARTSNGNAFIYQEDITMNLEAKALKDMMNIKADIYTVFDLLKNNEFSREVVYHDSDSGITTVYSADGVLGSRWGEFYSSDFYRRGIRGYTYAFGEGTACPADLSIDAETLYPVTIKLYTNISSDSAQGFNRANMIALLGSSTDMSEYDLTSEYTIMISGNDYDDLLSASVSEALSARGPMNADLSSLLQYSLNYIDYDYSTLSDSIERIETEGIRFPLLDFLYYSAITITTTGYGDILPNSSLVRAIVMLEAFIGIAIPGVFISLLFFKIDFNPERRKDV